MKKSFFVFLTIVLLFSLLPKTIYSMEIYNAIKEGNSEKARRIILERPEILSFKDYEIELPFLLAVRKGSPEVVRAMLEAAKQSKVDLLRNADYLNEAARYGKTENVRVLIEMGADVKGKDSRGWTALHVACLNGHKETIELLLNKDAPVNAVTYFNRFAPIHLAINAYDMDYLRIGSFYSSQEYKYKDKLTTAQRGELVDLLVSHGANVNQRDYRDNTALHIAVKKRNFGAVKSLVENGADLKARNKFGGTPLNFCLFKMVKNSSCGHKKFVIDEIPLFLISKGASVLTKDEEGKTPLYYAAELGDKKLVDKILEKGTDFYKDQRGREALILVYILQDRLDRIKEMKKYGLFERLKGTNSYGLLYYSIKSGSYDITEYLVNEVLGPNAPEGSLTPLHFAARFNRTKEIKLLLEKGANPLARAQCEQFTPLEVAARFNQLEAAKLMISMGVPIDVGIDIGTSPLYYAAENGHVEMMKYLLSKGASLSSRERLDFSPLKGAVFTDNFEAVNFLLDYGIKEKDPKVFETILRKVTSAKMAKLLISNGAKIENIGKYGGDFSQIIPPNNFILSPTSLEIIKVFIDNGLNLKVGEYTFGTPVTTAIDARDVKLLKAMLPKLSKKELEENGYDLLSTAVHAQDYGIFKLLLDRGVKIKPSAFGRSLLFDTVGESVYGIARLLIERGVDVNKADNSGTSPLHFTVSKNLASKWGKRKSFKVPFLLLENGAEHDVHTAAALGDVEKLKELLVHNPAFINKKDVEGKTPLEFALLAGEDKTALLILETMKKASIKLEKKDELVKKAMYGDCIDAAFYLMKAAGPLTKVNDTGETYLHKVASAGNLKLAEKLLNNGLDLNTKDNRGWTPLFHASSTHMVPMIRFLISRGAAVDVRDQEGFSPVQVALNRVLRDYHDRKEEYQNDTVFELIKNGVDVKGMTWIFAFAVKCHRSDVVRNLLDQGFDYNEPVPNVRLDYQQFEFKNKNLLNLAVEMNDRKITALLIDAGADVNQKDKWGWTPLTLAKANGYSEIAELLAQNGAKE